MTMRMQELAERSGLPRTTIHHYAREELLPPARKTARNAAEYDETHLERLRLIDRLRAEEAGGLSIAEIRRVIGHLEAGIDIRCAVRLVREGITPSATAGGGSCANWADAAEFAAAGHVPVELVESLRSAGLTGTGPDGVLTASDLPMARAANRVCAGHGLDPADLTPLADLIREVGNYSDTLADVQAVQAEEDGIAASDDRPLRDDLAAFCGTLLWRAFGP
jgi:DNA-binding transcriptional MerR regulator